MSRSEEEQANGTLPALLASDLEKHFPAVVERYTGELHAYAFRYVQSEAEDAVQAALIRAYFDLQGWTQKRIQEVKLRPYLYRITFNVCMGIYNRRTQRSSLNAQVDSAIDQREAAEEQQPEIALERAQDLEAVLEAINALPRLYQEVMFLRFVNELKIEEIAQLLKTTKGTIKSRISRAKALFRKEFGEPGEKSS